MESPSLSLVQIGCLADYENSSEIELTILMPNGLMTVISVSPESKLGDIKEDVFEAAQEMPLFGALYDMHVYAFTCVNLTTAEQDEIGEDRRLVDVKPFLQILRLVERKGDMVSKQLSAKIGMLIGKGLHEFDVLKNPEINDFRWRAKIHCEDIQESRVTGSWDDKVHYKYPVRVDKMDSELPKYLLELLGDENIEVEFQLDDLELFCRLNQRFNDAESKDCFDSQITGIFQSPQTVEFPYQLAIDQVISTAIKLFDCDQKDANKLTLKVSGQEEFLLGSHPLIKYKYIQECIANSETPSLILVSKECIPLEAKIEYQNSDESRNRTSTLHAHGSSTTRRKSTPISSLSVTEKFGLTINECFKINLPDDTRLGIKIGLFHGGEPLVHATSASDGTVLNGQCSWNETLTLDISICDIPRMARLCFVVYEIIIRARKGSRGKFFRSNINCDIIMNPLRWVNTPVYDFRGQLKSGSLTLLMWNHPEDYEREDMLNPLGTVMTNPNAEETTCLTLTFRKCNRSDQTVFYPHLDTILNLPTNVAASNAVTNFSRSSFRSYMTGSESSLPANSSSRDHKLSSRYLDLMKSICDRDPLKSIASKDQELLWYFRDDCREYLPHSLPHLLNCVKWSDHREVIEMIKMLQQWPLIDPEKALELLDYAYADCHVRSFAIKCLHSLSDDNLSLYLLQLVQALKCESYLYCDLVIFLLERALKNQTIGHHFFWLLRSEMSEPLTSTYFGLILEAYCRGAYDHMKDLSKQMDVINKLKYMNEIVKRESIIKSKDTKDRLANIMQEILEQSCYRDYLRDFINPLNPRIKLKTIRTERCKLMDSKMKPLWLVFNNQDTRADDVNIIFKNGDDLRQDMLTVQMIKIMDKIWKDEGLNLRMTPYNVIAIEKYVGLIQVVTNTQTLAKIQKSCSMRATSAFNKASLLNWLKSNNPEENLLNEAISLFTLSCAGYCVATYVLGIADRHSDNILVRSNGQILHIDFGHILGKFKEKFGIRRERVPFVLTNDFVYVITAGNTRKDNFHLFQKYCEQAFSILRKRGSFIISLFAMMLSSGIPELSSVDDLEYLRETLVLDLSEEEALKHFRCKFDDALKNSWKTNINWMAHNMAKDNH